jgi:hypothetical protein
MKILRFTSNLVALAVLALGFTSMANAQATRTWVSGVGDDANPCSRTAPCKTFAGAISKTAINGEIDCLDEGGFGQVTITKTITIDCDSGRGGILAGAGNGINISEAGGVIVIRNLSINGVSGATNGISITAAQSVHLQDVDVQTMSNSCVSVSASAAVNFTIEDSSLTNCGSNGVTLSATADNVLADLHNVRIWNNGNRINAGNGAHLNVLASVISFNTVEITPSGLGAGASTSMVAGSTLASNATADFTPNPTDQHVSEHRSGPSKGAELIKSRCDQVCSSPVYWTSGFVSFRTRIRNHFLTGGNS